MLERHYEFWPKGVARHLFLPQTSLVGNLTIAALRYPDKPAIIYYDSVITYRELEQQVNYMAAKLQQLGVEKGARVLLYMQNSPQWIIGFYAILRANAVVVPVNPMNKGVELKHYAEDTEASICLCGQELIDQVRPLLGFSHLKHIVVAAYGEYVVEATDLTLPQEVTQATVNFDDEAVVMWSHALAEKGQPGELLVGPNDLAVFPYTSGTTGAPKGCMHTHASVMATCVQGQTWFSGTPNERVSLAALPLFHVAGMQGTMNGSIYVGSTLILMTRWDRHVAAQLIERYKVTDWYSIVTMAIDLLSDPEIEKYDLTTLQTTMGGGAAMPEAISDKLFELTGLRYIEGYGLSETMAATHINPPHRPKKQCLGIPVFDVDARIIDTETGAQLGANGVGEIITHSPQMFQGYWKRPEDTAEAFMELDGKTFFRTGDLGYYDEEGYFFLVDRLKRMINSAGYKVWPNEIESLMYHHPAVKECCIISIPDERRGEAMRACVILAEGQQASEADIIDWCKANMSAYKVPQEVEFLDDLPRTMSGKIMWNVLQEEAWKQADQ